MKDKLQYNTNMERADFVVKYQCQNIADDLPNKIIYCLDDNEYLENGEVKVNENYEKEQLEKAKEAKLQENATKRDEHLLAGVVYKDVLFDSDTDQKINLQSYVSNMSDTDTVIWFGKDNQPLECTREDLMAIGGLIGSLTVQVWSVKNPAYVEAINNATTMEELNAINIDYN